MESVGLEGVEALTAMFPVDIRVRKGGEKIVCLTAYTASQARLLDPHVDILLVGDSLGMTIYGLENTLQVTLAQMIAHGKAVARAASKALVVVDMPFGSYQESPAQAFAAAAQIIAQTGCGAVKIEGGAEMAETITFLVQRGIPVMGHVGLMPQHMNVMGGFKYQGKDTETAEKILFHARAVAGAGAFALVIEGTREDVARAITQEVAIPTIGIGASVACDGQVLVIDDVLGLTAHPPRFAKSYMDGAQSIEAAVKAFAQEVRSGAFPEARHCFLKKD